MVKALISDFSRVLLFSKDKNHKDSLNSLHRQLSTRPDYKLLDFFEVNHELLNYYRSLTGKVGLYIFTSETIQDSPELQPFIKPVFKEIYSASKMGIDKKDPNAYKQIVSKLGLTPNEVIYIDDNENNIEAANKAGLQTVLYTDNESSIGELQTKLT